MKFLLFKVKPRGFLSGIRKFIVIAFAFQFIFSFFIFYPQKSLAYTADMTASVVIGQTDFTSNSAGTSATKLNQKIRGISVTPNGKLIISDQSNNRLLIYNNIPTTNGAAADLVLGQPDFDTGTANTGGRSGTSLNSPRDIWTDGNKLIVADSGNNRVLIWNTFPSTNHQAADVVVGQADFSTAATTCNASTLYGADGVAVYNNKLAVVDELHGRVVIYNSIPTANGAVADVVLGQSDFTSNCTKSTVATNANFYEPRGVFADINGRLFVNDLSFNRVLLWNSIPVTNNQPADVVIGQPDFVTDTSGTSSTKFKTPYTVYSTGSRLFVAEQNNNRISIFNSIPTTNGAAADMVIGQDNLDSGSPNRGQAGVNNAGFYISDKVFVYNDTLFVADGYNQRVLIFYNLVRTPDLTLNNSPENINNSQLRFKGKATVDSRYTVKSVEYSVNGGNFLGSSATDGSFNSTEEEYYFDFDPTQNQPKDDSGNLIPGYTIRVKSTNNNTDTKENLFYFSPFDLQSPDDNTSVKSPYPTFEFSVNKQRINMRDNLSKYQIKVRKGGSDSTANWETLIDDIPVDFRNVKDSRNNKQWEKYGNLDTNNGVYETDGFYAVYSEDSSKIKVYSKVNNMSGSYQWKTVAVDYIGHDEESGVRNLYVSSVYASSIVNHFPLAVLYISGLGNPLLNSYSFITAKSNYYTSSANPVFYGIAWANSKVVLKLTDQKCATNCTRTYSTIANGNSRYGINIPMGDLKYGKKYTAILSVMLGDKYTELPQFTLNIFRPR